jgi:gluconokinase
MKAPRSPHDTIHGLVYFPRMIEKIRLHAAGQLAEDCIPNLGKGFDDRCCKFLGISYEDLASKVREGGTDEEAWAWAAKSGTKPTEEQIEVWNGFMTKRGWRDEANEILIRRKQESGFESRDEIQTMFDYIDADEGRVVNKN